ncbi:unnamed protein product [Paramecium primaurelia]|uniref:Uncharacterized protein n=1 Tax=Paramecium primaurelia TaxID=5886 RepID=A0A8S1LY32_PARPR|nr:unnamed protein product [Paramecium primaurelia]
MNNNQVYDELEEFVKQQKLNDNLRIEAKVGTIIAKTDEALIDLQHFQDQFINVESKIEKKNYRFESAISKLDYEKACQMLKSEKRWEFTIDIIFALSYTTNYSFRMGYDEKGKIFCYERKKELKSKHLDILDQKRQYRITLSQYDIIDYNQTEICLEKIREYLRENTLQISCIRYKQTMIYQFDDYCESFVFQVQQIDKSKQAFLIEIAKEITNKNNTFKKNLDNAMELLQQHKNYYKPFYEAEISIKQYKVAQSTQNLVEKYVKKIQQFHDDVRAQNPQPTQAGVRDAQFQKKYVKQDQKQRNYNPQRGTQIKTRGQNQQQRQDRNYQENQTLDYNDSNYLDEDTNKIESWQQNQKQQIKKYDNNQKTMYNQRGRVRGRGNVSGYGKEREEWPNSDDEQFQSRQEDYY